MNTGTLSLFSEYNREANERMNRHLRILTDEQWQKPFPGFFPTIQSLGNHIYVTDFNWLKRFSGLREFEYMGDPFFLREMNFRDLYLVSLEDYLTERLRMDGFIDRFVRELREQDLEKDLTYRDSRGDAYTRNFGGLVLHMFNHQTHHRGMISLYLEDLGIPNDYNSLMDIL